METPFKIIDEAFEIVDNAYEDVVRVVQVNAC